MSSARRICTPTMTLSGMLKRTMNRADGALPGIVMLANPTLQRTYRQEFFLGEAEDAATVLSVSEVVTIGLGTFTRCLLTEEFTSLTPGGVEHKYYALGVGLILEVEPAEGAARDYRERRPAATEPAS